MNLKQNTYITETVKNISGEGGRIPPSQIQGERITNQQQNEIKASYGETKPY